MSQSMSAAALSGNGSGPTAPPVGHARRVSTATAPLGGHVWKKLDTGLGAGLGLAREPSPTLPKLETHPSLERLISSASPTIGLQGNPAATAQV